MRASLAVLGLSVFTACAMPGGSSTRPDTPESADERHRPPAQREVNNETGKIEVPGAKLTVKIDGTSRPVSTEVLHEWVHRSATMVTDYYGEFPVPGLEVTLVPRGRGGVGFGQHNDGRWLRISFGRRTTEKKLERDWVMVHEMLHACFPDLRRDHRWMQEGLSTYLEPIVRAQSGNLTQEQVWGKWVRNMHYGRPRAGDRGLDRTHTWGRTYWGGALFWMVVDFEIRKRTDNKQGLQDALRGIVAAGGNGRANWSTKKVVEVGDEATGTTAFSDTYAAMARAPGDVDIGELFVQLGVRPQADGTAVLDDGAPLADIRRAMVER